MASFYLNTSDWHFLILSIHTTCIMMSYIGRDGFLFLTLADLEFTVYPRLAWNSAILLNHLPKY